MRMFIAPAFEDWFEVNAHEERITTIFADND
jgi:hypothetical protein